MTKRMSEDRARFEAMKLAKGSYQRSIVYGTARVSGSDLKGKAKSYGARYAESRLNLFARMAAHGIPFSIETRDHGLRVLVFGGK